MSQTADLPGVENPDKIDFMAPGEDGRVILGISDHLDWSDKDGHLRALQTKINSYLMFAQSDAFPEAFPEHCDAAPRILVMLACEPSPEGLGFLNLAATRMAENGWSLEWQHVPSRI